MTPEKVRIGFEVMPPIDRWLDLTGIGLSEVNQTVTQPAQRQLIEFGKLKASLFLRALPQGRPGAALVMTRPGPQKGSEQPFAVLRIFASDFMSSDPLTHAGTLIEQFGVPFSFADSSPKNRFILQADVPWSKSTASFSPQATLKVGQVPFVVALFDSDAKRRERIIQCLLVFMLDPVPYAKHIYEQRRVP